MKDGERLDRAIEQMASGDPYWESPRGQHLRKHAMRQIAGEWRQQARSIRNLLSIIREHNICTDDMEDSCIRVASGLIQNIYGDLNDEED